MMIDILIPTYNRAKDLNNNLNYLAHQLLLDKLGDVYRIIISDNASTDSTEEVVSDFRKTHQKLTILYFRNASNIGLEANAVNVLEKSDSPYILWLGDDDFLAEGYLKYCYITAVEKKIGCIIPGLVSIDDQGREVAVREEKFQEKHLPSGYKTILSYSHLAHQMSGLMIRNKNILKEYLKHPENRNPYLFIFFVSFAMSQYNSVYAPEYKTRVNISNQKDWSYNEIGLLDEVYKSYYPFISLYGESKVADLMIKFTVMHSYRINFRKFSLRSIYKALVSDVRIVNSFKGKLAFYLIKEKSKQLIGK